MPDFDVLGRDVSAWADSTLDTPAATAVKQLWAYCGLDSGENPNHLWTVSVDTGGEGFSVSASVKDANVYVPSSFTDSPVTDDEAARAGDAGVVAADQAAPVAESEAQAEGVVPVPQPAAPTDAEAPASADPAAEAPPAAPVDPAAPAEPADAQPAQ